MDLIVEMKFGSELYGTATAQSDQDIKAVYLPDGRDILLQRVRGTISEQGAKASRTTYPPTDVERETYSLQRYLALLAQGQMVALDMLFAPAFVMIREPSALWQEIRAKADHLVTRRASSLVRYCRQQANKYGAKGNRIAAARLGLAALSAAEKRYGAAAKLVVLESELAALAEASVHIALADIAMARGRLVRHFEVCGRKMPLTGSIKSARETVQRLIEKYGQRALQAECNQGIDWKALSHAVRIGREALELLETGRITFPLSYAAEILAIRQGAIPHQTVSEQIERLLASVEGAAANSQLRDEPDQAFIDALVTRAYRAKVVMSP